MKDIYFLTRQILYYRLANQINTADAQALAQQFLSFGTSYTIADLNTTAEDWEANEFGVFVDKNALFLFLNKEDAERFAVKVGAVIKKDLPLVKRVSSEMIKSVIADYLRKGFISKVCIYGISPVKTYIDARFFTSGVEQTSGSMIMSDPIPQPSPFQSEPSITPNNIPPLKGLLLIDDIKNTLSLAEAKDRRAADPGNIYENFHSLLSKLIQANKMDHAQIDTVLGLPNGYTKQVCINTTSNTIPFKILSAYLNYFDLQEFLYLFKAQSAELAEMMTHMGLIDKNPLKHASVKTEERFTITSIRRGKDKNKAFVYKVELQSKYRKKSVIVSSNFGLIVGKEYEIEGLLPFDEGVVSKVSTRNAAEPTKAFIPDCAEENQKILDKIKAEEAARHSSIPPQKKSHSSEERTGRRRYQDSEEDILKQEINNILGYLIKTNGCSSKEAKTMIEPLVSHANIIHSFSDYVIKGNYNKCKIRDFTPKKLMSELMYSPYEAYIMLVKLEDDPKAALQELKYRACDPQYQKLKG